VKRTVIVLAAAGAVAATAVATAMLVGPDQPAATSPPAATPIPSESAPTRVVSSPSPRTAPFAPAAKHDWLTTIPGDLSVAAGLPAAGGDFERVQEAVTWSFCDAEAFPVGEALDAVRDGATGPEYADRRDLRVFRDDRAAHAFATRSVAAAEACPEERHGATRWIHAVSPGDVGEESMRILQTYETDGTANVGATWWVVTRVGNAVLLTATGGEYLPGETLGQGIRDHDKLIAPIVDSMCVFSAVGCGDDPLVLRHDGIGPLRLGMTADEARAAGAQVRHGNGCLTLEMFLAGSRITGDIDPDLGISMLYGDGAVTPQGIGPGSTLAEVRGAFAHLTGDETFMTSPVSDEAAYWMWFGDHNLDTLMLVVHRQNCSS